MKDFYVIYPADADSTYTEQHIKADWVEMEVPCGYGDRQLLFLVGDAEVVASFTLNQILGWRRV